MANTLRFKRGLVSGIPTAALGEPLFTTDTFDLYIGNGTGNTRFQKYIASGTTSQLLRGDGSLLTMPIVLTSPSNGQVLKYNGTSWVNDSDAGVTGSGTTNYLPKFTGATTLGDSLVFDNGTNVGIGTTSPVVALDVRGEVAIAYNATYGLRFYNDARNNWSSIGNTITGSSDSNLVFKTATGVMTYTGQGRLLLGSTSDNGLRFQVTGDGYFSGSVGIGSISFLGFMNLRVAKSITGNSESYGIRQDGTVQSDVNSFAYGITNVASTAAASFTLSNYRHFWATQGTFGAGSTVTNQSGFFVESNLTGATNNYGFYGNIAAGTGRWNLYMNGSAANFISGDLGLGSTTISAKFHLTHSSGGTPNFISQNTASGSWNRLIGSGTSANIIDSNNDLIIRTGASYTERMRLDASGRLGLGVVPSSWNTSFVVHQLGGTAYIFGRTAGINQAEIGQNAYFQAGVGWTYLANAFANRYILDGTSGSHVWFTAPSGTAGNAITFTQAMTLHSTGNLAIGTGAGADAGFKLDVNGTMRVSGNATMTNAVLSGGGTSLVTGTGLFSKSVIQVFDGGSASTNVDKIADLVLVNNTSFTDGIVGRVIGVNTNPNLTEKRIAQILFQIDGDTRAGQIILGTTNSASVFNNHLTIRSTGAATFSSSVTGASFIPTSSTIPTNGMYLSAANTLAFATASGNKLTISSTGLATFSDSARFSNQKGCIFVQTGGSLLGSISMDSGNAITIDNNGFFGLSVGTNYTMTGGNLGIGHNSFGTSATKTISVNNGTAPSSSPVDSFQMYSNDVVAGNAAPHFRTENGAVIKLYQETTAVGNAIISLGGGNAVLDDTEFDGYTLRQLVRALRNQGILQ